MLIFVLLKWLITIINLAQWLILKGMRRWLLEVECTGEDVFCCLGEGRHPSLKTKNHIRAEMAGVGWVQSPLGEGRSGRWGCPPASPSPQDCRGWGVWGCPPRCCLAGPLPAAPAFLFSSARRESRSKIGAGGVVLCRIVRKDPHPSEFYRVWQKWRRKPWPVQPGRWVQLLNLHLKAAVELGAAPWEQR